MQEVGQLAGQCGVGRIADRVQLARVALPVEQPPTPVRSELCAAEQRVACWRRVHLRVNRDNTRRTMDGDADSG